MSQTPNTAIVVIGIDIGKNSFHVVGHDTRGAIVLRQKWSRQASVNLPKITSGRPGTVTVDEATVIVGGSIAYSEGIRWTKLTAWSALIFRPTPSQIKSAIPQKRALSLY
jgi:hypothetical protein